MSFQSLLPGNAKPFELAVEEACDAEELLGPAVAEIHGIKYARPLNPTIAPYLVQEYGLAPISGFFDTVEELIDNGRAWQRRRGTPSAITTALGWIDYDTIHLEDQAPRRRRWHLYQIGMGELPGADEDRRLADAEYLADLSDPARAEFFRGFHGYDVRAMRWGSGRYGRTMWGDSSGVRINGGSVKWSHGRHHAITLSSPITDWGYFGWTDELADMVSASMTWSPVLSWSTPMLYWSGAAAEAAVKTWLLLQRPSHLVFRDAVEQIIGYARVIRKPLDNSASGAASAIYEIRTTFGQAAGQTAASVGLIFDLDSRQGVPPFKGWLSPAEVHTDSGFEVGRTAWAHEFQKTVRETVTLTFTAE